MVLDNVNKLQKRISRMVHIEVCRAHPMLYRYGLVGSNWFKMFVDDVYFMEVDSFLMIARREFDESTPVHVSCRWVPNLGTLSAFGDGIVSHAGFGSRKQFYHSNITCRLNNNAIEAITHLTCSN